MTPQMRKFLTDWLEWAESGAPLGVFHSSFGLCLCASFYGGIPLQRELRCMLVSDGLDRCFPFGEYEYEYYGDRCEMHLDPQRLDWVRSKVA